MGDFVDIFQNGPITGTKLQRSSRSDIQKACSIMEECKIFTLDTMNIIFKMLGLKIVANELITHLLYKECLIKHQGIYDIYYIVKKDLVDKGTHRN